MQFKDLRKNKLSRVEQACFWLLLVVPLALLYFRLAQGMGNRATEISLLTFLAWILTALFAALALQASQKASESSGARKSPASLWLVALLPGLFLTLIALIEGRSLGAFGAGRALLAVAGLLLLSNGFCWFFAHFGSQEMGRQAAPDSGQKHPALHLNRDRKGPHRYFAPLYPIFVVFLLINLFIFTFLLRPDRVPTIPLSLTSLFLVGFIFALFAFLGLNRFQTLFHYAKSQRIAGLRFRPLEELGRFSLGIILLAFFVAFLPLDRIVAWGERLRKFNPPRSQALSWLPQNQPNGAGSAGASEDSLLVLLIILILALLVLILARKFRGRKLGKRFRVWLVAAMSRLAQWLKRLAFRNRAEAALNGGQAAFSEAAEASLDVFENPEMLARLTPARIIILTYHLLLHLAGKRGWLPRLTPPLETLTLLTGPGKLDGKALSLLTWLYLRAAYSPTPPKIDDLPRAKIAWDSIKPKLLEQGRLESRD